MPSDTLLYEQDFLTWTERQAETLRRLAQEGSNLPLDFDHLAEEIESLGREIRHKVESLAHQILVHLLKLACSPADRPRAKWMSELDSFRLQLRQQLRDSPSLRTEFARIVEDALPQALKMAERNFRHFGEHEAMQHLGAWRLRGISVEQVLEDGLYPVRGSTSFAMDGE